MKEDLYVKLGLDNDLSRCLRCNVTCGVAVWFILASSFLCVSAFDF